MHWHGTAVGASDLHVARPGPKSLSPTAFAGSRPSPQARAFSEISASAACNLQSMSMILQQLHRFSATFEWEGLRPPTESGGRPRTAQGADSGWSGAAICHADPERFLR